MCKDCFDIEYSSFPSEDDWIKFDLVLTKKLGSGKMIDAGFVRDMKRDKDDGEYLYACLTCGQHWKLRDPDYADRGYFLRGKKKTTTANKS